MGGYLWTELDDTWHPAGARTHVMSASYCCPALSASHFNTPPLISFLWQAFQPDVIIFKGHSCRNSMPQTGGWYRGIVLRRRSRHATVRTSYCNKRRDRCCRFTILFSSIWYLCARKSPYALHPFSQKFPQRCLWNDPSVRLTDDGPLSSFSRKIV